MRQKKYSEEEVNLLNDTNVFMSFGFGKHAYAYALNIKPYQGNENDRLRPRWSVEARAERPKSGKTYHMLLPVEHYQNADKDNTPSLNHVPTLNHYRRVVVENVIVSEQEHGFYGFCEDGLVFATDVVKYPSFHHEKYLPKIFKFRYGLTANSYNDFKTAIKNTRPHSALRKFTKTLLGYHLNMYSTFKYAHFALNVAEQRNQILVYPTCKGEFSFKAASASERSDTENLKKQKKIRETIASTFKLEFGQNIYELSRKQYEEATADENSTYNSDDFEELNTSLNSSFCLEDDSIDFDLLDQIDLSKLSLGQNEEDNLIIDEQEQLKEALIKAFNNFSDKFNNADTTGQLNAIAAQQGFKCYDVERDGNCFYSAVLHQLHDVLGLKSYADKTKLDIINLGINEILEHSTDYQDFSEIPFDQLIERLMKPGEWADNIMIQAVSNALNIVIHIVRSDGAETPNITPRQETNVVVNLGYEVGLHYQSLMKTVNFKQENSANFFGKTAMKIKNAPRYLTTEERNIIFHESSKNSLQDFLKKTPEMINSIDEKYHCTLLMWCLVMGQDNWANWLIEKNADLTALSAQKRNLIHFAARYGRIEILKILVSKLTKENFNSKDMNGMTPLHLAVRENHIETVQFLISQESVSQDIINNNGDTPLQLAQANGFNDIINVLNAQKKSILLRV